MGSTHQFKASLVFTAFTLEAAFNHLGSKLLQCWSDIERLGPTEKLNLLAEHLGVPVDYGREPWQIMKDLFWFRNGIAHGKSMTVKLHNQEMPLTEYQTMSMAPTRWDAFCTQDNAVRAREDVEKIVQILYRAAKAGGCDAGFPFVQGMQVTSGQVTPNAPTSPPAPSASDAP